MARSARIASKQIINALALRAVSLKCALIKCANRKIIQYHAKETHNAIRLISIVMKLKKSV